MSQGYVPSAAVIPWLIRLRGLWLTQLWERRAHQPNFGMPVSINRYRQKASCRLPGTPEVDRIVENYRANLTAICRSGAGCGARTVLCTLSVNLRDWAPEFPDHLKDLSPREMEEWNRLYDVGRTLAESARWADALERFEQARRVDDTHAGLWWHIARCLLRLERLEEAREAFQAARDRDSAYWASTRSFLNETVRQVARQEASRGVLLADVEKALAERSEYGIVGGDLIPDSCHFSFRGHWEAARAILPVLEAALPEVIRRRRSDPARPITFDDMRQLLNHDPNIMLTFIRGLQGMVQAEENRRFLQKRIDTYEEEISSFASNPQDRLGVLSAYCGRVEVCPCRAAYEMDALSLLPDQDPTASGRKLLSHCPQYAAAWIGSLARLQSHRDGMSCGPGAGPPLSCFRRLRDSGTITRFRLNTWAG